MYPFDLERALKGEELVTEEGYPVLGFAKNTHYPTISDKWPYQASCNGEICTYKADGNQSTHQLFMLHPDLTQIKSYVQAKPDVVRKWLGKPVILTTHDGVEVMDGEQLLFSYNIKTAYTGFNNLAKNVDLCATDWIHFSTHESRHTYMVMNMPLLSVSDVRKYVDAEWEQQLIDLATSKLKK